MTTTNPLGLDFNGLAEAFADFQSFLPAPTSAWNDTDADAIYFIGAGSEYRLRRPTFTLGDLTLSWDAQTSYRNLIDRLKATPGVTDSQLATLATLEANLDTSCPGITVNVTLDHIRNNQHDDHAAIQVQAIWSSTLNGWLPAEIQMGFTWADPVFQVPPGEMVILKAPSHMQVLGLAADVIPVLGEVMLGIKLAAISAEVWNFAVSKVAELADDGGRVYFPMAVVQGLMRVLKNITPKKGGGSTGVPVPDLVGLARQWDASYSNSTIQEHVRYSSFAAERDMAENNFNWDGSNPNTTGVYRVSLPQLVALPGQLGTLYTFKVEVDGVEGYGAGVMLLDNRSALRMIAAFTRYDNGNTCSGPPAWSDGSYTSGLINGYFNYWNEMAMSALIPDYESSWDDVHQAHLAQVIQAMMFDFQAHTRQATRDLDVLGLPELPTVALGTQNTYVNSGARPALADTNGYFLIGLHVDPLAFDALYAELLNPDGSLYHGYPNSFQRGQDPSVAMFPDHLNALEVHGGDGNNQLYYSVIRFNGSALSLPTQGSSFDQGENPAIAISSSGRILEFHESPTSLSDRKLWLNWFTYTTSHGEISDISHSPSGTSFATGFNPAACFTSDVDFVVVYDRGGVYALLGLSLSETTFMWQSVELPVCPGDNPTVAKISGSLLLVVAHTYVNYAHRLTYSLGIAYTHYVQWIVTNVELGEGLEPALVRHGSRLLLSWRSVTDTSLLACQLDIDTPGYFPS